MLSLLKIRNLALVERLDWEIGAGLVGVTGETGAGKSVIVGALKLILGERADKGLIRTGEDTCHVEAIFELQDPSGVNRLLAEMGLEVCEDGQLLIKRVIGTSSNRQFVNNSPATLSVLKAIGGNLVDLHGPHDHQSLLSVDRQLIMLDAYAGVEREVEQYRLCWSSWREAEVRWRELRDAEEAGEQELELLKHQVAEIEAAEIDPEGESELQERYQRASNSAKLVGVAAEALNLVTGDGAGVLDRVQEIQRLVGEIEKHDPAARQWTAGVTTAAVEMEDFSRELERYLGEIDLDPGQAAALEDRVDLLESLKRKYGPSLDEVVESGARAAERLGAVENRGELLAKLEAEATSAHRAMMEAGSNLSGKRRKAGPKLAREIRQHLAELGFRQAAFEVNQQPQPDPSSQGLDAIEFSFGPNPGEPLKPLRQIASSGEISRVMLSIKSALARQDQTPLMVFDEIDANVGGEVARAVGEKMAILGGAHQVVAITHFPQVAALASQHFLVEKTVAEGRTTSSLKEVRGDERIAELTRMLGGQSEEARLMAKSLLTSAPVSA
ncbi:MAG TPA: DNA repair protein RecN [Verrucomicrobiales bacterium]|nr:DNA repair protein RecN [Roseibacillus sp.]HCQ31985.1 DNA repair protein RecN [Verrucomicrobiales bacterium]|tara:strand:+ start:104 stop:1771 length:1668 start_codon:yes stop_codon:yes gene_type:complete